MLSCAGEFVSNWLAGCLREAADQLITMRGMRNRIDLKAGVVMFESLKKRKRGVYRPEPLLPSFLATLNMVHDLRTTQARRDRGRAFGSGLDRLAPPGHGSAK